jgi:hypothetical protein
MFALVAAVFAQEYPGEEVPGTRTPIAIGDPVDSVPQRGHIKFKPRKKGGPTPYNCLAQAKGHTDVWIQPGGDVRRKPGGANAPVATMQEILADNGCTIVACADPPESTMCPPPAQLVWLVYGAPKDYADPPPDRLPPDDYWLHAMRRTPDGTWTSKDGTFPTHDGITDPNAVVPFNVGRYTERYLIRCVCCPIPGTVATTTTAGVGTTTSTAPQGQAVLLDQPLGSTPAGTTVCLNRLQGEYVVEQHAGGCSGLPHLHSYTTGISVVGVAEGPFPDPNVSGCGYGRVVTAACPG